MARGEALMVLVRKDAETKGFTGDNARSLRATLSLPHAVCEVNNGKSTAQALPHPMMEGEFLV